jgi:dTDP-4-amino-4,6-dideoxygalactose transaminase
MGEKLAIHGGEPAVTVSTKEGWQPPIEEQKAAVAELIDKQFLSGAGHGVGKQFEEEFAAYTGADYCLSTDHGSNALMSALYAVGVGPGDEVIVPSRGYIGTYTGVIHLGAKPIFCDCDPNTGLIDPADAEKRITAKTRAIMPIHFNGTVCDIDGLLYLRQKYGVAVVHDACHAHPARWDGVNVGSLPDVVGYSLQGTDPNGKPVSGGEGGVVTTNNREFYERVLIYCHLHRRGIDDELTNPVYAMLGRQGLGLKWRAHPVAMALARISLQSVDYRSEQRATYRARLFAALEEIPGITPAKSYAKAEDGGFYGGYRVFYEEDELNGVEPEMYREAMRAEGVNLRFYRDDPEHLRPLIKQGFDLYGHDRGPVGPGAYDHQVGDLPVTEEMLLGGRVMRFGPYIEPAEGLIDQTITAFEKVSTWYQSHGE